MQKKWMAKEEFSEVWERKWMPVQLLGDAVPTWMKGIPESVINCVYASGIDIPGDAPTGYPLPSGDLVGGVDVYRNAPDDPVKLNKDWYAVIRTPDSEEMLLVAGPYKDHEHWINDIPERLKGAEVLRVPPKE
jgi:hypothetical protein